MGFSVKKAVSIEGHMLDGWQTDNLMRTLAAPCNAQYQDCGWGPSIARANREGYRPKDKARHLEQGCRNTKISYSLTFDQEVSGYFLYSYTEK